MFCSKCGQENSEEAKFCKKCGNEINKLNDKSESVIKTFDEKDKNYKKIKNAGTSAVALGWFNLVVGSIIIILSFGNVIDINLSIVYLFLTIIFCIIFIKYGNRLKKVIGATPKDNSILLWTNIIIIILGLLVGNGIGLLFIVELFYLISSKSAFKNIKSTNN